MAETQESFITSQGGEIDPRRCEHLRENGERCKGWKVRGESLCAGHLGRGIASDPEAAGRQSGQRRLEMAQAASKRAVDVVREAVEQHAGEFVSIRLAIARDVDAPPAARLTALQQLEERALGKAVQTQLTGEISDVDRVAAMTPEERAEERRRLEERRARLQLVRAEDVPASG